MTHMGRALLALALCLALLCGCWDKHELEDNIFVIMLGLDKTGEDELLVSVVFPITQTNMGGAESQGDYTIISARAPTVAQAMSLFGASLAGPLSLFSTKTLVISEELARDDMLRHIFSGGRYEQMRNNTSVVVARGSAADFIAARIENPAIDPLRSEDLLLEQANFNASYRPMQLLDFMVSLREQNMDAAAILGGVVPPPDEEENAPAAGAGEGATGTQAPPTPDTPTEDSFRAGFLPGEAPVGFDNRAQISGLAVFSGQRMVGTLDSFETQTLNLLLRSRTRKILSLPDPDSDDDVIIVAIRPTRAARIRGYFADDTPTFDITLNLRCSVEHQRAQSQLEGDAIEQYVTQAVSENIEALLHKLQHEYHADLLGLGGKFVRNFLTVPAWEAYNWRERYPDAALNVHLNIHMERTGV